MISSEVQRTLVKSPPELWAELSDPAALARHLGELGEIRITRVEAEQKVEWQAGDTSGTVVIKPSGWGTKVKLTATRQLPEPEPEPGPAYEPPAASMLGAGPRAWPAAATADIALEPEPEPAPNAEPALALAEDEPEPAAMPRRGFLARLFGRRRRPQAEQDPTERDLGEDVVSDEPPHTAHNELAAWAAWSEGAAETEAEAEPNPEASEPDVSEPGQVDEPAEREAAGGLSDGITATQELAAEPPAAAAGPAAQQLAAEQVAAEQVTAVLTGVLDRLGAAHHRPFSRA